MRKSGSTLAWQLARSVLELAGLPQAQLPKPFFRDGKDYNRAWDLNDRVLDRLLEESRGQRIAVATHLGPNKLSVGKLFEALSMRDVLVQVVLRDPRDIAVAMLDERAKKTRSTDFDEVLGRVCANAARLRQWCALPSLKLFYDDYAFDRGSGPAAMAGQLGVTADADAVWELVDQRHTRLNVGRSGRYRTDLTQEQAAKVEAALPGLIRAV